MLSFREGEFLTTLRRAVSILILSLLLSPASPLPARPRAGDKLIAEGRLHEQDKEGDAALELYQKALQLDPSNLLYRMAVDKTRFQAAQAHIEKGLFARSRGMLEGALAHFETALHIDPSASVAETEIRLTREMLDRERHNTARTGCPSTAEEKALTPVDLMRRESQDERRRLLPVPRLQPLSPVPVNLKMVNQSPRILFETVGKYAGINVIFDSEYQPGKNTSIELMDSTIGEALDCLAVLTRSFWKPLSRNTIFVTNDNPTKRRDYEEQVIKVFYLSNINTPQELQEVITTIRSVADLQRVTQFNSQYAIIARGEADKITLAEKIIADLDKPRSEVVVDILVIEADTSFSRQISAAIAPTGLNVPVTFSPHSSIQAGTTTASSSSSSSTSTSTITSSTTTSGSTAIPLSSLGHLSSSDFSITLPSALLQAALSDANTKIVQSPQVRSVDSMKATLKIGNRQPTATGSYQPAVSGTSVNALVNTQFTYIDVGVNVDLVPRVHENGDVSMHIELEISNVNGQVSLGGIDEPIIGQRKVVHDIRMREGEVNLLGGLMSQQQSKTVTGIPGLSSLPVLRRLFTGESVDRSRSELMIVIIPHIVRRPEVSPENIRGIATGNSTVVKLNYARPDLAAPAGKPVQTPDTPLPAPAR